MSPRTWVLLCMTAAAMAQPKATISGVVRDKVTKQPLADYVVTTSGDRRSTTDRSGQYRLSGFAPGRYTIYVQAQERFLPQLKRVIVVAGQDLDHINLDVPVDGTISGKVVDENKEPVPNVRMELISRQYYLGSAGYFYTTSSAVTDDQGRYTIAEVPPGRPFLLLAAPAANPLPAHSDTPVNPKFRKHVAMRTWYPNSPAREGAEPLVLRPGEHREGMDMEVRRSTNQCVDGTVLGPNGTAAMMFRIEALQPSSGSYGDGGSYVNAPYGTTGADGKLRICDLGPGDYRLEFQTPTTHGEAVTGFGVTYLTVKDEDQHGLRFATSPGQTLTAEVVWDTPPPENATPVKLSLHLQPTLRTGFPGLADWEAKKIDVPGGVSFDNLFLDVYEVQPDIRGPGLYVKAITYGDRSVWHEPLRYGTAMAGAGLRIVVARDGGRIAARVADKDGNPIADACVVLFPADAASEGALAATMVTGQTDQLGQYQSKTLAPGAYYVLASEEGFDLSVASIDELWRSRTQLRKVDLAANGSAHVDLELASSK